MPLVNLEQALSKAPETLRDYFERACYIFDPSTPLPNTPQEVAVEITNLKKSIINLATTSLKLLDLAESLHKELQERKGYEKGNT